jgi:hypothetical protein
MTSVSSVELNERACFLLSQGRVSEGLELFKKALSILKKEIKNGSMSTVMFHSNTPRNSNYQEHETTAGIAEACLCCLVPVPKACKKELERFWIYSRPLSMLRVTNGSTYSLWSNHSDALTISFNVALASHLRGVEQVMGGDLDAASHSFIVAMRMYKLALCQCQASSNKTGAILNTLNDLVYAAIFNNLAHVHVMLGDSSQSTVFAEQLLKTLFYLVDSRLVTTIREVTTHKLLFENAYCLLMASFNSAAAA